jgi:glycosyltransferase involved in cell wall biosynthesis
VNDPSVPSIAVVIPCYNEEQSIAKVVHDFQKELPDASIHVFDNNSTDNTAQEAKKAGAILHFVKHKGKGNVVRAMFMDVDADIYVMVDGDDTYFAKDVHVLLEKVQDEGVDMCVGDRHSSGSYKKQNTRKFHNFGNHLVTVLINFLYEENLNDIMSGYRVFSKEFVKYFPIHSRGFEIETEMSMHALDKRFCVAEVPISYKDREAGSVSKLHTFTDGIKILKTIFWLFKDYKPLVFFTFFASIFFVLSLVAGIPVIVEFIQTAYVSKVPSAILAVGLMIVSLMFFFIGLILDTVTRKHKENFELMRLHDLH